MPKVVYDVESELNGRIRVVDVGRTRKIVVDNIIQYLNPDSPACGRLVWGQLADHLKERMPEAEKVLIFGMGGGTMASLISRNFPNIEITSVEYDPVMIDIAERFFNVGSIPNHTIINADALRVAIEPEKYDLIPSGFDVLVVDVFNGERYPDLGKTGNFISAAKRLVRGGGLVIFNRIYTEPYQEDVNIFMDNLEGYFSDVSYEVVAGYTNSDNIIIFGRV